MQRAQASQWPTVVLLVILTVAAGWAGLTSIPPLDRDEARVAQASVQMIETGDFVRIQFLDQARHKKPAGVHWLQASAVTALSHPDARAIWAYRMPSLFGAIIAVLATYAAGVMLIGRGPAATGAALFAVSVLLGAEAGIAKTDAMLTGLTALTMTGLAAVYCGKDRRYALLFWGALAGAVLVKGPIAPTIAGLAIVTLIVVERRFSWLKPLAWWPGPLLAVAIAAPWIIAIQRATDGAFLADAVATDLAPKLWSVQETNAGWPLFHSSLMPVLFWPGTMFVLPGLALTALAFFSRLCARKRDLRRVAFLGLEEASRAAALRFLAAWTLPSWLVFEFVPTKLPHYTLPLYPALALMTGAGVYWLFARETPRLRSMAPGAFYGIVVLLAAACLAMFANIAAAQLSFPLAGLAVGVAIAMMTRPEEARAGRSAPIDVMLLFLLAATIGSVLIVPFNPLIMNLLAFFGALVFGLMLARRTPPVETISPGLIYSLAFFSVIGFVAVGVGLAGGLLVVQTAIGGWSGGPIEPSTLLTSVQFDIDQRTLLIMGGIALGLPLVFTPLMLRGAPRTALVAACAAGLAWQWAARGYVVPRLDALFVGHSISQELQALSLHPLKSAGAQRPLVATGFAEPSLAFLTDTSTVLAEPEAAAIVAASAAGRASVVEERVRVRFETAMQTLGADIVNVGQVSGYNYSNGTPVMLSIYRTTGVADEVSLERARAALATQAPDLR